jgi:transcriptional regulator with XRE-family HTH domain
MYSVVSIIVLFCRLSIHEYKLGTNEFILGGKMYSLMNSTEFASWLQNEMNERGWNNSELARRAGVSRGAIGNVLRGDRGVGKDIGRGIAKALNLPPEEIYRMVDILPPSRNPENDEADELAHKISLLPQEDQQILITLIEALLSKRGKVETERTTNKQSHQAISEA